jgi:uroporphyrinogen decarboxylase
VVEEKPDGSRIVLNEDGGFVVEKLGIVSIPTEVDHMLKSRKEWDGFFKPRLQFDMQRINRVVVNLDGSSLPFSQGGCELLQAQERSNPYGLFCGSLFGVIRDWLGLVTMSYLMADDPALFTEMIETVAELCYQGIKAILETGARFDYAHFWEDICYKGGPLINPRMFAQNIGPHYKCITDLLKAHDIQIVSLDCDGKIDALIPTWLENGVNTMFPIEVGTWDASIKPGREKYGRALRGVGGVKKVIFAQDYAAIDAEVERLRSLVELGGYIPCPDHRIPADARWENIQYYCERMRKVFGYTIFAGFD